MIEKPDINDEVIISALQENYSLSVNGIRFLPAGNDPSAWAYRIDADFAKAYFLKIRRQSFNLSGLFISRLLKDKKIDQVVAPLPSKGQELSVKIVDFALSLYPFIAGDEAMEVGMTDAQWIEFGTTMKQIHSLDAASVSLPKPELERETFIPKWGNIAMNIQELVNSQVYENVFQKELAKCWKEHQPLIRAIFDQTNHLGKLLRYASPEFVFCHADIHTANILVTREQNIFMVDWDGALLAPKERDLMFVVGNDGVEASGAELFFKGYGDVQINPLALAYYRYEWCVQEIGDYGERVFGANNMGLETQKAAVEEFIKLFSRDNVIEVALATPTEANEA